MGALYQTTATAHTLMADTRFFELSFDFKESLRRLEYAVMNLSFISFFKILSSSRIKRYSYHLHLDLPFSLRLAILCSYNLHPFQSEYRTLRNCEIHPYIFAALLHRLSISGSGFVNNFKISMERRWLRRSPFFLSL